MVDSNGSARLAELVEQLAGAPPSEIITRFRRSLSAFGVAGIEAVAPILADDDRRHAVALIIREIAKDGPREQSAGCIAIQAALRDVRPAGQAFLIGTLLSMGCEPPDPVFEPGTRFTPIWGGVTAHHAVVDEIEQSSTRFGKLYLAACRWVFSEVWVQAHGGLTDKHGGRYCWFCSRALGGTVL